MISDFKNFLMKGNVLDLAVAVVMGAAFKPVISALVEKIIMPPIGLALGGVDFNDLKHILQPAAEGIEEVAIGYGAFIQSIVDFIIIGFCIFMVVKIYERSQKKAEEEAPSGPSDNDLLMEIRDLLKKKK